MKNVTQGDSMPRLVNREKRRVIGQLAVTTDEAERIRAGAARAGMSVMRWARETLLTVCDMQDMQEARRGME